MQQQDPIHNFLPVHTEQEAYHSEMLPGNGMSMPAPESDYLPSEASQLQELLNLLYAGRWLILAAFLVVLGATALYTYTRVPIYKADSLVLLDNRVAPDLKDALDPEARGASSRSVDTEVYVLQRSREVARRVGLRLDGYDRDPVTGNPLQLLSYGLSADGMAAVIQEQVSIFREPVEDVLRISAASVEPWEARLLADLYAEEFVDHALGRSRSRLAATRYFLENEANERNRELKQLEEQMRIFMDQHRGLTLNDGANTLLKQVTDLGALRDEIMLDIRMTEVVRRDLVDEVKAMEPRLAEQVLANVPGKIEQLQENIAEVESDLDQIYRRNPGLRGSAQAMQNDTIVRHTNEIERLKEELARLTGQYIQQVAVFGEESAGSATHSVAQYGRLRRQLAEEDLEVGQLRARLNVVNRQLASFQEQLQGLPAQTITLTQLKRSIQTTERAYLMLKEKLEDVRISEESEQGYAEIILKAEMPVYPDFPNKPRNLVLGGLLGLLLGLGLAVARQQIYRNTVQSPEDIQKMSYPLIGVVPSMKDFIRQKYRGVQLVEHNGYLNDSCLISLQPPSSFVVDAYRRMRYNIHGVFGEGIVQTLLVTSPNPGEGKSITALNLAIASAQAGKRTVVIDTDLRRPSIHTKLGIDSEPGFTEMIAQRRLRFRKALSQVDNLYVLTAGRPAENSGEVISSKEMPQFVEELKRLFDMVILDSPPYMLVSDPLMLSALCDGTVIVASAGKTNVDEIHQGMHELQKIGGQVLGIVLNEFDPAGQFVGSTRYKHYSYTNHYTYHQQADTLLQP